MTTPEMTRSALASMTGFLRANHAISNLDADARGQLDRTVVSAQRVLATGAYVSGAIGDIFTQWDAMLTETRDALAELRFRRLVLAVGDLQKAVAELANASRELQSASNELIGALDAAVAAANGRIRADQADVNNTRAQLQAIEDRVGQIKKDLSGANGFWKSFAEGLSLGIYHEPTDELNELKRKYDEAQQTIMQLDRGAQQLQHDLGLLATLQSTLGGAVDLYTGVTALENIVSNLSTLTAATEHDGTKAVDVQGQGAAKFFHNRFTNDLGHLRPWQGVF